MHLESCESCRAPVELDAMGRYRCQRCDHAGFYIVTPIPALGIRPEHEDTQRLVWLKFLKRTASSGQLLGQVREVMQNLKDRPLAELHAEIEQTGGLTVGPFFPNEAAGLRLEASRRGIETETKRTK